MKALMVEGYEGETGRNADSGFGASPIRNKRAGQKPLYFDWCAPGQGTGNNQVDQISTIRLLKARAGSTALGFNTPYPTPIDAVSPAFSFKTCTFARGRQEESPSSFFQTSYAERGAAKCCISQRVLQPLSLQISLDKLLSKAGALMGADSHPLQPLPEESFQEWYWGRYGHLLAFLSLFIALALVSIIEWGWPA